MSAGGPRYRLAWDEGQASERTVLSWERTAISSLAVAALIVRAGIVYNLLGLAVPLATVMVVAAIGEWLFGLRLESEHDRPFEHGAIVHDRALTLLALVTLISAVGATTIALIR